MITAWDIKKAVAQKLKEVTSYSVYVNEVKEGIKRPCFFIEVIFDGSKVLNNKRINNNVTILITYLSATNTDTENHDMINTLWQTFVNGIWINERYFLFNNISFDFVDDKEIEGSGVLQCHLETEYFDTLDISEPTYEMMQAFEIKINNEEV